MELQWLLEIQNSLASPEGDRLMIALSTVGNYGLIWIGIALVLCAFPKWRKAGLAMLLALLAAHVVGNLFLKNLIGRPRPYIAYPAWQFKIPAIEEFSFPSGHTIASFAAVFSLPSALGALKRSLAVVAVAISFSRLYLFMHYPSDILGGLLLGVAIGCSVASIPWFKMAHNVDKTS